MRVSISEMLMASLGPLPCCPVDIKAFLWNSGSEELMETRSHIFSVLTQAKYFVGVFLVYCRAL